MTDEYQLLARPPNNKALPVAVIAGIIVLAVGGWYWYSHRGPEIKAPAETTATVAPVSAPEARIEHPVPGGAAASRAPLPALDDSDKAVVDALSQAAGGAALSLYLVPDSIIRHFVATVDNLPRQRVAADKRPVTPAPGSFIANGDELHATLDAQNFQRYVPMVDVLRKLDMQRLAAVYLRFYPLFQAAYQNLGYPDGYFNDRLVKVIDLLLATPQISGPIDLVRPNVMYVFSDPSLESRPAGQKVLIRIGPDNAAVVKAKLAEFRAIITAAPPKR